MGLTKQEVLKLQQQGVSNERIRAFAKERSAESEKGFFGKAADFNKSVGEGIGEFSEGFVKGGIDLGRQTLGALDKIGEFGLDNTVGRITGKSVKETRDDFGGEGKFIQNIRQSETPESLQREGGLQKFGGFAAEIGGLAAPITKISKATTAIQGLKAFQNRERLGKGAKLAADAVGVGVVEAVAGGLDAQRGLTGAAITAGLPIAGKPLSLLMQTNKNLLKGVAGVLSGKGTRAIDAILENPVEAMRGLRDDGSDILTQSVKEISDGAELLREKAAREFRVAADALPKTAIPIKNVIADTDALLEDFGLLFKKGENGKSLDADLSLFDKNEAGRLQEAYDVMKSWSDTSAQGLHTLSRKLQNFTKPGEQSPELNAVIGNMSRNVLDTLGNAVPDARVMLDKYKAAHETLDALMQEFRVSGYKGGQTAAEEIKTGTKVNNLFTGEKTLATEALDKVADATAIQAREAGRQMNELVSRANASIGETVGGLLKSVISPRMIGEITAKTGIAKNQIDEIISAFENEFLKAGATTEPLVREFLESMNIIEGDSE